ncbi:MAG: hypothetical protein COB08_013185 [Rhodobacteraceae bacterium]|nr:hypothetical protein [Paracoccaceae bacterium]
MEQVFHLTVAESGYVDFEIVGALKASTGAQRYSEIVEDVVFSLTEKITALMSDAREREFTQAERQAAKIGVIARQIGLKGVAGVAAAAQDCAERSDYTALSAVSVRLARMTERSLFSIIEFDAQAP